MRVRSLIVAVLALLAFTAVAANFGALAGLSAADGGAAFAGTPGPDASGGGASEETTERQPTAATRCPDCSGPLFRSLLVYLPTDGLIPYIAGGVVLLVTAFTARYALRPVGEEFAPEAFTSHSGTPIDADRTPEWSVPRPPATNDVYRAWRSLRNRVADSPPDAATDATPHTATPQEVARLALDRGDDGEAVDTLTTLFQQVRYGDGEATATRETAATAALDRLADQTESAASDSGGTDPATGEVPPE